MDLVDLEMIRLREHEKHVTPVHHGLLMEVWLKIVDLGFYVAAVAFLFAALALAIEVFKHIAGAH